MSETKEPRMSMDMSNAMQMEHIGYMPEYSMLQNQRRRLRAVMDSLLFEGMTIAIVLVYAVILFIDMTASSLSGPDALECQLATATPKAFMEDAAMMQNTSLVSTCGGLASGGVLYYLDLIFLTIFMCEIVLRLIGYGIAFLREAIQAIDCAVVTVAFITAVLPTSVRICICAYTHTRAGGRSHTHTHTRTHGH